MQKLQCPLSNTQNLAFKTILAIMRKKVSAFKFKLCCFSTNCVVEIKPQRIILLVHLHSTVFYNVIALKYLIIPKHTHYNDDLSQSIHLQKLVMLPYALRENDSSI